MSNKIKEVSFYHLTTLPITKAVPRLIEKVYYSKQRLLVIAENEELMRVVDDGLWAYSTKHFIPHATYLDEDNEDQPVLITTKIENANNAEIILSLGEVNLDLSQCPKLLHMFDGNIANQLEFARRKWKEYNQNNISLVYWKQNIQGGWDKQ